MRSHITLSFFLAVSVISQAHSQSKLILRLDDVGMNHSVNEAIGQFAETGLPFSASVMFACPWYQEAVDILKVNPQISVGVHLTLNSEWKYYRWGPVMGKEAVPSLVDEVGYFRPSTAEFLDSDYKLEEVESELEAQIQRALASGLKIDYVDYHMRTALATSELKAVADKLASKYNLKRSMQMGENFDTMFGVPVAEKKEQLYLHLTDSLKADRINVLIIHVAKDHPEMKALVDMNNPAQNEDQDGVASHRRAELDMLIADDIQQLLRGPEIELINYSYSFD